MTHLDSHSPEVGSASYTHSSPHTVASLWVTHSKSAPEPCPPVPPTSVPPPPICSPRESPPVISTACQQPGCCLPRSHCQAVSSFHRLQAASGSSGSFFGKRPPLITPVYCRAQTPGQQGGRPAPSPQLGSEGRVSTGRTLPFSLHIRKLRLGTASCEIV